MNSTFILPTNTRARTSTSPFFHPSSRAWSLSRSRTEPYNIDTLCKQPSSIQGLASVPTHDRHHPGPTRSSSKRKQSVDLASVTKIPSSQDSLFSKSPLVPALDSRPEYQAGRSTLPRLTTEPLPITPILTTSSSISTIDSRSPSQRRAPASHSSYGVETSNGPPPSFSTQRTLSQDRLWKPTVPDKANIVPRSHIPPTYEEFGPRKMSVPDETVTNAKDDDPGQEDKLDIHCTPKKWLHQTSHHQHSHSAGGVRESRSTDTFYSAIDLGSQTVDVPQVDDGSRLSEIENWKDENLSLHDVEADAAAAGSESATGLEKEIPRSETRNTSMVKNVRHSARHDAKGSPAVQKGHHLALSPSTQLLHLPTKHSMASRSGAASAHPAEDSGQRRYRSDGWKLRSDRARSVAGRTGDEAAPKSFHGGDRVVGDDAGNTSRRRSTLSAFGTNRVSTTTNDGRPRSKPIDPAPALGDGTESTTSTASPSTVWDELDDLKLRIRKLERTGKLPSSSAAAMSAVERPLTAPTTVTTTSSSPNHGRGSGSTKDSAIEGISATVHPLLHEALWKSRPLISPNVYQKLEATASDALQLASTMGAGLPSDQIPGYDALSSAERQLRRRADSMCRGLTELALALSAESPSPAEAQKSNQPNSRDALSTSGQPSSANGYGSGSASHFGRRSSVEAHEAHLSSVARVQSRLASRRSSLQPSSLSSSPQQHVGSELILHTPSSAPSFHQTQSPLSGQSDRAASRLRSRRTLGSMEGIEDYDHDNSPSVRSVSRARTEVGLSHRRARDRASLGREYTSSHPLPNSAPDGVSKGSNYQSPSVLTSSGLHTRRSHALSTSKDANGNLYSPATPRNHIQPGYRRYASAGISQESSPYLSFGENSPDHVSVSAASRRSLGFASRLGQRGSLVDGRLQAAKARQQVLQGSGRHHVPAAYAPRASARDERQDDGAA